MLEKSQSRASTLPSSATTGSMNPTCAADSPGLSSHADRLENTTPPCGSVLDLPNPPPLGHISRENEGEEAEDDEDAGGPGALGIEVIEIDARASAGEGLDEFADDLLAAAEEPAATAEGKKSGATRARKCRKGPALDQAPAGLPGSSPPPSASPRAGPVASSKGKGATTTRGRRGMHGAAPRSNDGEGCGADTAAAADSAGPAAEWNAASSQLPETGEDCSLLGFLDDGTLGSMLSLLPIPFLLSSTSLVCRRWRRLASHPSLHVRMLPSPFLPSTCPWGSLKLQELLLQISAAAPHLQVVAYHGQAYLTGQQLLASISQLPNLRDLTISGCPGISGSEVSSAVSLLPEGLSRIDLHCDHAMAPESCRQCIMGPPPLLHDPFLLSLSQRCTGLLCLDLDTCSAITSSAVSSLVAFCPLLEQVRLHSHALSWSDVTTLLEGCTRLQELSLVSKQLAVVSEDADPGAILSRGRSFKRRRLTMAYGDRMAGPPLRLAPNGSSGTTSGAAPAGPGEAEAGVGLGIMEEEEETLGRAAKRQRSSLDPVVPESNPGAVQGSSEAGALSWGRMSRPGGGSKAGALAPEQTPGTSREVALGTRLATSLSAGAFLRASSARSASSQPRCFPWSPASPVPLLGGFGALPQSLASLRLYSGPHCSVPWEAGPALRRLRELGGQLKALHAHGSFNASWQTIGVWCTRLQVLDLSHPSHSLLSYSDMEEVVLCGVLRLLPHLTHLALPGATDAVLVQVSRSCPKLEELRLQGHSPVPGPPPSQTRITDVGVGVLLERCRRLRVLSLSGCRQLTPLVVRKMVFWEASLRELHLEGCRHVDDAGLLTALPFLLRTLQVLDLVGCNVTVATLSCICETLQAQGVAPLRVLGLSSKVYNSGSAITKELRSLFPAVSVRKGSCGLVWDGFLRAGG